MRYRTATLILGLTVCLVTATLMQAARAALFDYQLNATWTFNGNGPQPATGGGAGTIGFDSLTGVGAVNPSFAAFSFTITDINGIPGGLPFTFTKTAVEGVSWLIDPVTFALRLKLDTMLQMNTEAVFDLAFDSNTPGNVVFPQCAGGTTVFFGFSAAVCRDHIVGGIVLPGETVGGSLSATLLSTPNAAPEPATLMLLATALLMLIGCCGLSRNRGS